VLVGIAATLVPHPLLAQAEGGMRRLGVLMPLMDNTNSQALAAGYVQQLGALNWREGSDLLIDWRWARGDPALFERYAAELVALAPHVIVAWSSPAVAALQRRTNRIPIVFTGVSDPIGQGFVESLAHPGGNITGFSSYDPPMAGKWLQMLTQITQPAMRAAILYNPTAATFAAPMLRTIDDAARSLAVVAQAAPVNDEAEFTAVTARLASEGRGGLLVLPDAFNARHFDTIIALAARYRLPAVYPFRFFSASGGLMSYGIDQSDLFRRSAAYVDRILKGANPADLPVQNPTKFELVINLKTAKALGITFPPSLLAGADAVIE